MINKKKLINNTDKSSFSISIDVSNLPFDIGKIIKEKWKPFINEYNQNIRKNKLLRIKKSLNNEK